MVIDVHVHPTGYSLISQDPAERKFRTEVFQKKVEQDHSPIAMTGKPSGGNSFDHGSEEVPSPRWIPLESTGWCCCRWT